LITTESHADAGEVKREISRLFHRNLQRNLDHIIVEVHDGTVALRGNVSSWIEKQDAAKAARNAPGVSRVENYLGISG
jgi:osmotically-inducible protein OsmY